MTVANRFNEYKVGLWGATTGRTAYITCYDAGQFAGRMDFYAEGATLPHDFEYNYRGERLVPILSFPIARFHTILEILRQESPLWLRIFTGQNKGTLLTSDEPVGEEEGALG